MPVETITGSVTSDEGQVTSSVLASDLSTLDEKTLTDTGFYWRERDGVRVLVCKPLEDAGFVNGFSTRLGGVSNLQAEPPAPLLPEEGWPKAGVVGAAGGFPGSDLNLAGFDDDLAQNIYENRRRFLSIFDGEFELATAWQVHGDGVKVVRSDEDVRNSEERFDALVSARGGTLVGVKTADCVPILIGDPVTRSFAAVHSGWKGTATHIVSNAIEKMKTEFGADPRNMIAAIGPCASGENYEIGQDVIDRFGAAFPDHEKYFRETRPGHAMVDLRQANRDIMTAAGVPRANIYTAPFCTIARTDLFFSYRVEKNEFGKTGRLMSVIGLAEARDAEART